MFASELKITPASKSMSSAWVLKSLELLEILIVGDGNDPNAEPLPVVKHTRLQPPAMCPVELTGSYTVVCIKKTPHLLICSE